MRIQTLYRSNSIASGLIAVMTMACLPGICRRNCGCSLGHYDDIPGLRCSTTGVANGFTVLLWKNRRRSPAITPGRTARVALSDLTVTKSFDECSPTLFDAVTTGGLLNKVTLTQSVGGVPKMTVVLMDALVSAYDCQVRLEPPVPRKQSVSAIRRLRLRTWSTEAKLATTWTV